MTHHLLAGGGGFIGSHLAEALLARGDSVTVIDNFVTGRRDNIGQLLGNPHFRLVDADITQVLPTEVLDQRFDTVLDLASPASPTDFTTLALEIMAVGSVGTRHLLDLATRDNARFLLASTSEVYGDPDVHPQPESYLGNVSCIGPRSCYDEAKRFSEALSMAYHRTRGTNIRIVRIFNTYGERMRPRDGRVVNTFIAQALADAPITIFGDGSQTRSFCHVSDEVRGLLAVLDGDVIGPVNIGNPSEISMLDLAQRVIQIAGSSSEIVLLPLPTERHGDPQQRCPDISLAVSTYGWKPEISLETGLTRMIHWFREHEDLGS